MDIERLKELRKALNTENWNAKTMIEVIAIIDEAIARQSETEMAVLTAMVAVFIRSMTSMTDRGLCL